MRAHVGIDRRTRRDIEKFIDRKVEEERHGMTRRVFKAFIYVLNTEFGFGVGRVNRLITKVNQIFHEEDDNFTFWRHIDHHVIDFMGIPFDREKIDLDGNLEKGE